MTKKTVNIFFIILGFIIITISTQKLLLLPLIIGLIATIQGILGFLKNDK
tara:strand:+ start:57 stop:206 length:150 start_codon:yes stop_codon:yes gene_type:complete